MNQGKLNIVKDEMERMEIDVLGISELKWTGKGHFQSEDYKVFYSGRENLRMNGVAIILNKDMLNYVLGYNPTNDRIISIRFQGKPINITIIQVYAPTTAASGEVIEDKLQEALNNTPRKDLAIIMGDCNAKVGKMKNARVTGQFGLGDRNEAGDRLVQFCEENELSITNTFFEQPDCRLYTWTTPDGNHRNQIDYIICKQRWKTAVQSVKTRPGADCGSDHKLLLAGAKIKLKKKRKQEHQIRYDTENIPIEFLIRVSNRFMELEGIADQEPEEIWGNIKQVIEEEAKDSMLLKKARKRSKWISNEAIKIAEKRRMAKARGNKSDMAKWNAVLQEQIRKDKEKYLNDQCKELEM